MANRIIKLPPEIVNRIAAGEVVERPAAVIKELGENALDAGATRIEIDIEAGGKQLIRIRDDGSGIGPTDLPLALASHATSKLADASDLMHIASFGFRGEALASIGSVATVTIRSRLNPARFAPAVWREIGGEAETVDGFEISAVNGALNTIRPCGCPPGTEVTVRELFAATPARFKFLKSAAAELSHVVEAVQRLAVPHAATAFVLRHDARLVFELPAEQTTKQRIVEFWGGDCGDALREVHGYEADLRIEGFVSTPAYSRPNGTRMMLFLNGRFIRDRSLLTAVREAYREFLPPGRYPAAVLFIDMPVTAYDVNVHPQKTEVRFREPRRLFARLRSAVRERLMTGAAPPRIAIDAPLPSDIDAAEWAADTDDHSHSAPGTDGSRTGSAVRDELAQLFARSAAAGADANADANADVEAGSPSSRPSVGGRPRLDADDPHFGPGPTYLPIPAVAAKPGGVPSTTGNGPAATATSRRPEMRVTRLPDPVPPSSSSSSAPRSLWPGAAAAPREFSASADSGVNISDMLAPPSDWRPLADGVVSVMQVNQAIVVVEYADRLVLIDQHALHERVMFAQLQRRWSSREIERQKWLIAEPLDLTRAEQAMIADPEVQATLRRIGFEVEIIESPNGVEARMSAAPALLARRLSPAKLRRTLEETLENIAQNDEWRRPPKSPPPATKNAAEADAENADDAAENAAGGAEDVADFPTVARHVLATLACKAAIKVGDSMTTEEILGLLVEADKIGTAFACPHGRPTTLELPYTKLNHYFGR